MTDKERELLTNAGALTYQIYADLRGFIRIGEALGSGKGESIIDAAVRVKKERDEARTQLAALHAVVTEEQAAMIATEGPFVSDEGMLAAGHRAERAYLALRDVLADTSAAAEVWIRETKARGAEAVALLLRKRRWPMAADIADLCAAAIREGRE